VTTLDLDLKAIFQVSSILSSGSWIGACFTWSELLVVAASVSGMLLVWQIYYSAGL
jgi:hypothetical protein